MFDLPVVRQGWQCPVCKRVYSPTQDYCLYCGFYEDYKVTNVIYSPKETTTIRDIMTGKDKQDDHLF